MDIGNQFNVVTVSIDPTERPVACVSEAALYTGLYGRPGATQGWHFLTGDEPQIKQLANAVGFRYAYDAAVEAIRARQRDHDADAGRKNLALLLRHPVSRRAICGSGSWKRRKERSGRRWIRFCCSATTTIRRQGNTAC